MLLWSSIAVLLWKTTGISSATRRPLHDEGEACSSHPISYTMNHQINDSSREGHEHDPLWCWSVQWRAMWNECKQRRQDAIEFHYEQLECWCCEVCGTMKREKRGGWWRRGLGGRLSAPLAPASRVVQGRVPNGDGRHRSSAPSPLPRYERGPFSNELHGRRGTILAQEEEDAPEIRPKSLYVASLRSHDSTRGARKAFRQFREAA